MGAEQMREHGRRRAGVGERLVWTVECDGVPVTHVEESMGLLPVRVESS